MPKPRDDKEDLKDGFIDCPIRLEATRLTEAHARARAYNLHKDPCVCSNPRPFKLFLQFPHGETYRSFFQKQRSGKTLVYHKAQAMSASAYFEGAALGSQHRAHLVDTGSSYHLISPDSLTKKESRRVEDMVTPLHMSGVGGGAWARQQVEIYIPALQCKLMMYLTEHTAPIISVGKLVREQRIKYVWSPDEDPYFVLPNGKHVACSAAVDVPYMGPCVGENSVLMPVGNAGGASARDSSSPDPSGSEQIVVSPNRSSESEPEHEVPARDSSSPGPSSDPIVAQAIVPIDSAIVEQAETLRRRRRRLDQASAVRQGEPLAAIAVIQQPGETRQQARRRRQRENHARSTLAPHNLLTHFPKDPKCEICQQAKPQRAQCRRQTSKGDNRESHEVIEPKVFADALTADHAISDKDNKSRHGSTVACVIIDRATGWLQSYPCQHKSIAETRRSFQRFLGPNVNPKYVYTDGSAEFEGAMSELGFSHDTSTPHRPSTNGIAENAIKKVKEGTSCALWQSGLSDLWWPEAQQCFCLLHNLQDANADEARPFRLRFGEESS